MSASPPPAPITTTTRQPLRRRALRGLQRALYWSGAGAAFVRARSIAGATILMYHSVPGADVSAWIDPRNALPPPVFERQMEFLAAHRHVISMTTLADALEAGESVPAGSVVLTFDDGYRDNLTVVAPVLAGLGLPALLYLPTGYISRGENQWVDRLYAAFQTRTSNELTLSHPRASGRWDLGDTTTATRAYGLLCSALIVSTHAEREDVLTEIVARLRPAGEAPRLMLTWEEVRELTRAHPAFEIGGHTVDHTDMSAADEDARRQELSECLAAIERETGTPAQHFSYPYGRSDTGSRAVVAASGVRTAVASADAALIRPGADPFALPRVESPASSSLFRYWTGGAHPELSRRLVGRA